MRLMRLTMLDGKAINALMATGSSSACSVCGATPAKMNNLTSVRALQIRQQALQLCLSSLHARTYFFECVLYIACRLNIKVRVFYISLIISYLKILASLSCRLTELNHYFVLFLTLLATTCRLQLFTCISISAYYFNYFRFRHRR